MYQWGYIDIPMRRWESQRSETSFRVKGKSKWAIASISSSIGTLQSNCSLISRVRPMEKQKRILAHFSRKFCFT
jgi:hypothetical protein